MNENENTATQNLWDSVKAVLSGRFIEIQAYLNKQEKNQINNLTLHLKLVQAGFRKGRGTRDQIANILWITEKEREFQKNIYFCFINYAKAFNCVMTIKWGKFWRRWEYQITWPASWETCMQVRKQQLELDMEQQTGYK